MIDALVYLDSHLRDAGGDPHFQLQLSAGYLQEFRNELAYRRDAMRTFSKIFNPRRSQFPQSAPNWTITTAPQSPVPDGYVYFMIEEGDGRFVKIGRSENTQSRLYDIQTGNPRLLKTVRKVPGGAPVEKWFHDKFAQSQIRSEWFYTREEMTTIQPP